MGALNDTIEILKLFTFSEPAIGQAELARRLDRPKATVHRALKALKESGLLDYDSATRLYSPGMRLFELGQIFRSKNHFLDLLTRQLQKICDTAGHTGYITVFDGSALMVLRMIRGSSPLAIATAPGYRAAAHSTSNGRAMLALLDDAAWRQRVPEPLPFVSKTTPANHAELKEIIGQIRATGRSSAANESYEGAAAQGVAMRDPDTDEIYGVAISYPISLLTPELKEEIALMLDRLRADMGSLRTSGSDGRSA